MAINLETLELRIQANAEEAEKGLSSLISSLESFAQKFSAALTKPYSDLRDFNQELKNLKNMSKIKISISGTQSMKTVERTADAVKKGATSAIEMANGIEKIAKASKGINADVVVKPPNPAFEAEYDKKMEANHQRIQAERAEIKAKNDAARERIEQLKAVAAAQAEARQTEAKNMLQSATEVDLLTKKLNAMTRSYLENVKSGKLSDEQMADGAMKIRNLSMRIGEMVANENAESKQVGKMTAAIREEMDARGQQAALIRDSSTKLDLLRLKYDAVKQSIVDDARAGTLTNKQLAQRSLEMMKIAETMEKLQRTNPGAISEQISKIEAGVQDFGTLDGPVNKLTASFEKMLSSVARITKTMLIRTAIRAVLKGAKEGLDNFYRYSKSIGNGFAEKIDEVTKKWNQIKNQIGSALGTALAAILPILNTIAQVALVAFNAISALFALLSGSDTYSQATAEVDGYKDSVNDASKATKDLLASFDELNVIQSGAGGGGGNGGLDFEKMFQEVSVPQWMIEWKPIIEAILAGTLGAVALPLIFDWIKKLLNLFGGQDALNALDIFKHMLDLPEVDFDAPTQGIDDLLKKFDVGTDVIDTISDLGDLVGTLSKLDWKKLLVDNLPELIKLGITAITQLLAGLDTTTHVKVDDKELKEWKEKFEKEEWTKEVKVTISNDNGLSINNDDVSINVIVTVDDSNLTKWKASFDSERWTKQITINVTNRGSHEDPIADIDDWLSRTGTKKITVSITDNQSLRKEIDTWVDTKGTKKITVSVTGAESKMQSIDDWINNTTAKKINVNVVDANDGMMNVDEWVSTLANKKINVNAVDNNDSMGDVDEWVNTLAIKQIKVQVIDDNEVLGHLETWINTEDTKKVKIKFTNGNQSDGGDSSIGDSSNGEGKTFWQNILDWLTNDPFWNTPIWDYLQDSDFFNKPIWEYIDELLKGEHNSVDVDISKIINLTDNKDFKTKVEEMLKNSITGVLSVDNLNELKKSFPDLTVSDILTVSGFATLEENARKELVTSLMNAFGSSKSISELKKAIPNLSANGLIQMTDWDKLSSEQQKEFVKEMTEEFGSNATKEALKGIGVDIGEMVQTGVDTNQPVVEASGAVKEGAVEEVIKQFDGMENDVSVGAEVESGAKDNVVKQFDGMENDVSVGAEIEPGAKENTVKQFNGMENDISIGAEVESGAKENAVKQFDGMENDVNIGGKVEDNAAKEAVKQFDGMNATVNIGKQIETDSTPEAITKAYENIKTNVGVQLDKKEANKAVEAMKKIATNKKNTPTVTAKMTYDKKKAQTTASNLSKEATDKKPTMNANLDYDKTKAQKEADEMAKIISENKNANMTVKPLADATALNSMRQLVQKPLNVNVRPNATDITGFTTDVGTAIGKAIASKINGKKIKIDGDTVMLAANGGLVQSGDVFIANENGKSEMIGRFGNQTAVANQEQMVEAMARGVEYANSQQNSLLREQNNLLRAILQKDNSVRIGASSALGRVARQSLDMYASAVGG